MDKTSLINRCKNGVLEDYSALYGLYSPKALRTVYLMIEKNLGRGYCARSFYTMLSKNQYLEKNCIKKPARIDSPAFSYSYYK